MLIVRVHGESILPKMRENQIDEEETDKFIDNVCKYNTISLNYFAIFQNSIIYIII